ncbi:hypothetical protein MKEN_00190200 [Mycena kentingensis (nom. inval.)]|nr:hypothetical protein MKEN_00190200 [Mycena kentingensis (nom. inval.)]
MWPDFSILLLDLVPLPLKTRPSPPSPISRVGNDFGAPAADVDALPTDAQPQIGANPLQYARSDDTARCKPRRPPSTASPPSLHRAMPGLLLSSSHLVLLLPLHLPPTNQPTHPSRPPPMMRAALSIYEDPTPQSGKDVWAPTDSGARILFYVAAAAASTAALTYFAMSHLGVLPEGFALEKLLAASRAQ